MNNISVPRNVLAALIDMAISHVQDIKSGIEDGTYDASENKDIGDKNQAVEIAEAIYQQVTLPGATKSVEAETNNIHDQNVTSAYIMEGLMKAGYDDCLAAWGHGSIELVSEMVAHVPYVTKLCEQYDEYPGVLDYEVSEPFGTYFGKYIIDCFRAPSKTECEAWLSHAVAEFFNQGKEHDRRFLADRAFEAYNFGEGVSVVASDCWNTDDENDYTKIVYVAYIDDHADADSHKVSFHVRFNGNSQVEDAYALEMEHGNDIGCRGDIAAVTTGAEKPKSDAEKLIAAGEFEINPGTQNGKFYWWHGNSATRSEPHDTCDQAFGECVRMVISQTMAHHNLSDEDWDGLGIEQKVDLVKEVY